MVGEDPEEAGAGAEEDQGVFQSGAALWGRARTEEAQRTGSRPNENQKRPMTCARVRLGAKEAVQVAAS